MATKEILHEAFNDFKFLYSCIFHLLFVNDFFPHATLAEILSKKVILLILIVLVNIQIASDNGRYKKLSKKAYVCLTIYTVGLWSVLTFLGGKSQLGLSFNVLFFILSYCYLHSIDCVFFVNQRESRKKESNNTTQTKVGIPFLKHIL